MMGVAERLSMMADKLLLQDLDIRRLTAERDRLRQERDALKREVEILRLNGNKGCTAMTDEILASPAEGQKGTDDAIR
jgi:cell division protein FtsB